MSFAETFTDWWQVVIIAPLGFAVHKVFNLNSRVSVSESKISILEESLNKLCEKHDETNNILREIKGQFEGHFKHD